MLIKTLLKSILRLVNPDRRFAIQLDVTNACNLACIHCYHLHHNNSKAISFGAWEKILNEIKLFLDKIYCTPEFIFCGGEPLVSKNLFPLINKINSIWHNPPIAILTNGTLISEDLLQGFNKEQIWFQVSLDGPNSELHDKIRGKDNFQKTLTGINLLVQNNFKVNCLAVLSKNSAEHTKAFFELAQKLNVQKMNFERFITQGEGENLANAGQDQPLEKLELKNAMVDIINFSKEYNIPTNTDSPLFCLIDKKLGHNNLVGLNGIVIDYMGNLKVSSRTNHIIGNVLNAGLLNLYFKNQLLKSLRNGDIETCGNCEYYTKCGGSRNASYAKYKNYLKKDPGCWYKES